MDTHLNRSAFIYLCICIIHVNNDMIGWGCFLSSAMPSWKIWRFAQVFDEAACESWTAARLLGRDSSSQAEVRKDSPWSQENDEVKGVFSVYRNGVADRGLVSIPTWSSFVSCNFVMGFTWQREGKLVPTPRIQGSHVWHFQDRWLLAAPAEMLSAR